MPPNHPQMAAAARALAGQARAGAVPRPRVAAALLQAAARAPPPGAASPNPPAPGAPPLAAASRSALAAAILGPRAPPPLAGGSPRAVALLGPHRALHLLGPRGLCFPLAALGHVRFSTTGTGVRIEPDSRKVEALAGAGESLGNDAVPAAKATGDNVLQSPTDAAATRSTADHHHAKVKGDDDKATLAALILGPRAPPPLGGGSPLAAAPLGPRRAPPLLGSRVTCLPPSPLAALGILRFSTTGPGVESDDNKSNRIGDEETSHSAGEILGKDAVDLTHHCGKENGVHGDKSTLAADINDEHGGGGGNTNCVDDKVCVPKTPADTIPSTNVEGDGASNLAGVIPGKDEETSHFAGEILGKNAVDRTHHCGKEKGVHGDKSTLAADINDEHGGGGGGGNTNCVDDKVCVPKTPVDAIPSTNVEGDGASNLAGVIPGKDEATATKAEGASEGRECRCDCAARFNAFKAYSDENKEAMLNKVKEMLDEHREEQLKDREFDKSSRMTQTVIYAFITLSELGLVAMLAVLYGVGYAVEKAHEKMLALSKDKKTDEMVTNILDFVFGYVRGINRSIIEGLIRSIKGGVATVGYGVVAIFVNVGNGTAAVVHGIAGMISKGVAAAWNVVAVWRRWGHKEEKEEKR